MTKALICCLLLFANDNTNIVANDTINLNSNNAIITANIKSDQYTNIKANTATILNATNTHESYNIDKKTSISIAHIQDILKQAKSGKSV